MTAGGGAGERRGIEPVMSADVCREDCRAGATGAAGTGVGAGAGEMAGA